MLAGQLLKATPKNHHQTPLCSDICDEVDQKVFKATPPPRSYSDHKPILRSAIVRAGS
jgi:hypothetical protein